MQGMSCLASFHRDDVLSPSFDQLSQTLSAVTPRPSCALIVVLLTTTSTRPLVHCGTLTVPKISKTRFVDWPVLPYFACVAMPLRLCAPQHIHSDTLHTSPQYTTTHARTQPKINEDPKDAMLREFQDEILKLKAQLEAQNRAAAGGVYSCTPCMQF